MSHLESLALRATFFVSGVHAGKSRDLPFGGQEVVGLYRGHSHVVVFSADELETNHEDGILFKLVVQFGQFKIGVEDELGPDLKPVVSRSV